MKRSFPTRRAVLRGAGGFALALPLLPSLLPEGVEARGISSVPPRFVSICTGHGGVWSEFMHPEQEMLTESTNYGGHQIRRGDLVGSEASGRMRLSEVISGDPGTLTPELIAKMNVIRGLDIPFYIGHNRGSHLGNWAGNNGDGSDGLEAQAFPTPTIDQVMAWSDSFYRDLSITLERSMVIGNSHAFGWTSQQTQNDVTRLPGELSSLALFNRIFVPEEEETSPRPPVVDRVLEQYQSLREGNRRLSSRDRQRLDEHIERIDELQRRLQVSASCGDIAVPTTDSAPLLDEAPYYLSPEMNAQYWSLFNDVIVAAFSCGTSRIAVMGVNEIFSNTPELDWHQDVAHQAHSADGIRQALLQRAARTTFESTMLDLIEKLDIDEGDGTTMLDNTLVQWTQESGPLTHVSVDHCIVTAGSAGGCIRTGQYLDYRNLDSQVEEDVLPLNSGLLLQQYYASTLQMMGLSPQEYELEPGGGYPRLFVTAPELYPEATLSVRGDVLPWFQA